MVEFFIVKQLFTVIDDPESKKRLEDKTEKFPLNSIVALASRVTWVFDTEESPSFTVVFPWNVRLEEENWIGGNSVGRTIVTLDSTIGLLHEF